MASKGYLFKGAAWRKGFLVLQVCLVSGNPDYDFFQYERGGDVIINGRLCNYVGFNAGLLKSAASAWKAIVNNEHLI